MMPQGADDLVLTEWNSGLCGRLLCPSRLSELADEVDRTHERVRVTRNGRESAVLTSSEDVASLEATIELLRDPGRRLLPP
jgi:prevent-host-death family protein